MRFFIDAHLPSSLSSYFTGHEVIHASELPEGTLTSDNTINKQSVEEKWIVVTKDTDFYYSYIAKKEPYKLILVKLGNLRLRDIKEYFQDNADNIINLMSQHSFIVLEYEKIRILE
jgi:predicted nuclease of predicted toxin-antitoxin system